MWEGCLDEHQSTVVGTQCKVSHFSFRLLLSHSSSGSEDQSKEKYSLNAKTIVNKPTVVLSEIRNGQFDPVLEKKKKKEEKLWANNTGSGKSVGFGLCGIYENIKYHGQNTLYWAGQQKRGSISNLNSVYNFAFDLLHKMRINERN